MPMLKKHRAMEKRFCLDCGQRQEGASLTSVTHTHIHGVWKVGRRRPQEGSR